MIIEFGEYMPDQPPMRQLGAPHCHGVLNALPKPYGYSPFPGFASTTTALASRPLAAYAVRSSDRRTHTIAADANTLYRLQDGIWVDVSRAAGYTTSETWNGVQWGDTFYMTNRVDVVQKLDLSTEPFQFQDVTATDMPRCRYLAVVRDFLMAADCVDADGDNPRRVRWSPFNNPEGDWTPGQNQADFQDLHRDGFITGLISGDYGVVFQERAITRFDYVGGDVLFDVNKVEEERGSQYDRSIIKYGNDQIAYLGRDGFYNFDGRQSYPIGAGKVNETFLRDLDDANSARITATVDKQNQLLLWAYPGPGNVDGTPNRILVYNYSEVQSVARWAPAQFEVELLAEFLSESWTLEQVGVEFPILEEVPFSLDSRYWVGGNLLSVAFDSQYRAGGFTGTPYDAFLETREFSPIPARRARINQVRPVIDQTGDMIAQIGSRNRAQDPVTWCRESKVSDWGDASVRANGRYFRVRLRIEGAFEHALGIEIAPGNVRDAGTR